MTRRIKVVYTNKYLSSAQEINEKRTYQFLCEDDTVTVGDMLMSSKYSTAMQVTEIYDDNQSIVNGIRLSTIDISSIKRGPNYKPNVEELKKEYERLAGTPQATVASPPSPAISSSREASILDGLNNFINSVLSGVSTKEVIE